MLSPRLLRFVRANPLLVATTLAMICVVGWFGAQLFADFLYFNDPRNVDVALKGWMTPRYVVLTYDLPRPVVRDILELPPEGAGGIRLSFVAQELGLTLDELTTRVREAAEEYRAQNP
ncbi:MAG: hypothetical protein AAF092_03065 [Pseudomonadota bacterium]